MPGVAVDPAAVEAVRDDARATRARSVRRARTPRPACCSAAWLANASRRRRGPRAARVARAVPAGERPRDVARLLGVDQLVHHRPGERLERLGHAQHAQLRAGLEQPGRAAGRDAVRAVERREVVVEREHEAQPLDRPLVARAGARSSPRHAASASRSSPSMSIARRTTSRAPRGAAPARRERGGSLGHTGFTTTSA